MSATFACPHCGATYPRKPVLVGRAVRCTTCKKAFCLREDGIADPVEMESAAPPASASTAAISAAKAPAPAAPAPTPTNEPKAQPKNNINKGWDLPIDVEEPVVNKTTASANAANAANPANAKTDASARSESTSKVKKTDRLTSQQLDARRQMAATLASSMNAALESESVKREESATKTKANKTTEGKVGKIGPAVLTGQGVEDAKFRRTLLLAVIAAVIVFGGLGYLIFSSSPQQKALAHFSSEVDPARSRAGERVLAMQERAWLIGLPPANVGVPPLIDLHNARISPARTISLSAAAPLFASLKNLIHHDSGLFWLPADKINALEITRSEGQSDKDFIASVLKQEKKAVSHPAFLEKLQQTCGMSKEDAQLIELFILGRTSLDGKNAILERWIAGEVPQKCEVSQFSGKDGLLLLSRGQSFKTNLVHYDGQLVRFIGPGWPEEWKVLNITTKLQQTF
jgi:hypothetical protein